MLLVVEAGLDPGYVMDHMEFYEIDAILNSMQYRHRQSWEQTRMICYILAQSNSTKSIKPTDIICFPWDDDHRSVDTSVNTEDIERLKKKAEQYIKSK